MIGGQRTVQKHRMAKSAGSPGREGVPRAAPKIGRLRPAPLYVRVRDEIAKRIAEGGAWQKGSLLPSEAELAAMLGVSLGTVRRSLGDLASEGLIARRPKTGTIVTGRAPHIRLEMLYRYFRLHGPRDTLHTSQARVITYACTEPTPQERAGLKLGADEQVHRMERIRLVEGTPIMWERVAVPWAIAPELGQGNLPEALATYLRDEHSVRISASREKLYADLATALDRERLNRTGDFAILVIEAIAFDQIGNGVIYTHQRAVTDSFVYINEVN